MSILSVDNISPIGSGTSVTVNSAATLVLTNANSTGVVTATTFSGSGASLTNLPAANLTGTLPAISGANLTGVLKNIVEDTSPQLGGTLDTNNQDILINGAQNVSWDSSAADFIFNDYAKINLGTDKDFRMYQAGNNTILQSSNTSGGVYLQGALVQVGSETGEAGVKYVKDNQIELYFNNNKKLETTNTGAVVTGICTATSFSGSGENLTRVTQLSHRNLIINGAMQVAQRGTSSTSAGYQTVDRISQGFANVNENPTCGQSNVSAPSSPYNLPTSGDHPYKEGFRKTYYVGNGNQTTAAGANQDMSFTYKIEGQDLVGSGWNFADPNSYLTISFWIKTSVAQTYYVGFRLYGPSNGNQREYCFNFTPAAFTWTKVTHSIPGHASNTLREDNEMGAFIQFVQYWGTNYTSSGRVNEAWQAKNNNSNYPDMSGNYYNQNDASYQITGLQLEVGQQATPFEHRSFTEELTRCYRYYRRFGANGALPTPAVYNRLSIGYAPSSSVVRYVFQLDPPMRINPVNSNFSHSGNFNIQPGSLGSGSFSCEDLASSANSMLVKLENTSVTAGTGAAVSLHQNNDATAYMDISAEL